MALVAGGLPVLLGGAGFAVDVAQWYLWKKELQFAVDQAAISGAWTLTNPATAASYQIRAQQEFAANKDKTSAFASALDVHLANYAGGTNNSVVASASATKVLPFTGFLTGRGATVAVSAQASYITSGSFKPCLIALDPSTADAVLLSGSVNVTASCGIGALSNNPGAIRKEGADGNVDVGFVITAGGIIDTNGHFANETKITDAQGMIDPYASVTPPNNPIARNLPASCVGGAGSTIAALPGTYRSFVLPCNVILAPGIYVIDGGSLTVDGTRQLTGAGVMFVLKNGAGIRVAGSATVNLTAMTVSEMTSAGISSIDAQKMPGMLVYEDPSSNGATGNAITGGSNSVFNGVIYLPKSPLAISGQPRGTSACMVIASKTLVFSGSVNVSTLCPPGIVPTASLASSNFSVRLVA